MIVSASFKKRMSWDRQMRTMSTIATNSESATTHQRGEMFAIRILPISNDK